MAAVESLCSYFWTQILKQIFKNEFFSSEYLEVNLRPLVGLVSFFQCRKCYLSFIGLICLSAVVNMHEDDSLVTNRLSGFFSNGLDGCKHFVWIFFVSSSLFSGRGR